eukprot:gb/GECH01006452.1/.p1 GENE.gb/GECH01006452.1/~~gb/GECH01006452.1/.p1  ORF type:complete len:276 (+),score=22.79 gb/GECH01006452.1/:1-828(+)
MSSSNLRMPILETGNLCHLMIIDLIGYITLTIASGAFCGVKYKCVRMLRKQESPDASTHALILITGMSIFINGIIRMAACFTYMAIQYSSLTPSSPHVEDYLMAPLYFEELGFLVFFCTFAYLIFSWWHIVGGLKRRVHDYTVTQLVYYALGILGVMALLLVPSIALMPVRWNSDVFFYAWMWSILAPIALLSIVTAAAVAFLGYRMVRKARKASKGNKITSKRDYYFVSLVFLSLLRQQEPKISIITCLNCSLFYCRISFRPVFISIFNPELII